MTLKWFGCSPHKFYIYINDGVRLLFPSPKGINNSYLINLWINQVGVFFILLLKEKIIL